MLPCPNVERVPWDGYTVLETHFSTQLVAEVRDGGSRSPNIHFRSRPKIGSKKAKTVDKVSRAPTKTARGREIKATQKSRWPGYPITEPPEYSKVASRFRNPRIYGPTRREEKSEKPAEMSGKELKSLEEDNENEVIFHVDKKSLLVKENVSSKIDVVFPPVKS